MNISTNKKDEAMTQFDATDMKRAMTLMTKVIERRNTIPILANVLIDAKAEQITLTGTDLDIQAVATVPAHPAGGDFRVTMDARLFANFVRNSAGLIEMTYDGEVITLENDGMKMRVNDLCPPEDFLLMRFEAGADTDTNEAVLKKMIDMVSPSISTEETRHYLKGIYMLPHEGKLRGVATDGHRISIYTTDTEWPLEPVILPKKTSALIAGAIGKGGNGSVKISQDGNKMRLEHPDWILTTKTIDGKYPDYTKVIPKPSTEFTATLSHAQLSRIPTLTHGWKQPPAKLSPESGMISVKSYDGIEVSARMDGHGPDIGFNLRYLKDFTKLHGTVKLSGAGPKDPVTIIGEDPAFLGFLMPMRVS